MLLATSSLAQSPLLRALAGTDLARLALWLETLVIRPGAAVVREGETERDMYFLVEGTASVERGGMALSELGPGAHFGEVGLIVGAARAASVVARAPLVLARLSRARYERMAAEDPALALHLLHSMVDTLGRQLRDMTDSVGALLRERSLPRRATVTVQLGDAAQVVPTGTLVSAVLPGEVDGSPVVAGLVDWTSVSLRTPLASDARVAPLTLAHWEGERIARASVGIVLLEAAAQVERGLEVRVAESRGTWRRVAVGDAAGRDLPALARKLQTAMAALVTADAPIRREFWMLEEARAHLREQGWVDAAALLATWRDPTVPMASCGSVYALGMDTLLPSTGRAPRFQLRAAGDGLELHFAELPSADAPDPGSPSSSEASPHAPAASPHAPAASPHAPAASPHAPADAAVPPPRAPADESPRAMLDDHQRWLRALGVASVGDFNARCVAGSMSEVIRVAEGFHEKRIGRLADRIAARRDRLRVICVAGPSSSGKTTFIKRLTVQLQIEGFHPIGVSLDDYFLDREATPRDAAGDYDFEAFEALDHALLQRQLRALLAGESVPMARFDFATGRQHPEGGAAVTLHAEDVLLLEGIHGLNPRLLGDGLAPDQVFRVFIHPATTLPLDRLSRMHASDLRLLRRIVRDRHTRNTDAAGTILRWPSVRRGERLHIFPFLDQADAVFDSALVYEPAVVKVYAERYLLEVPGDHPAHVTAHRLRHLVDRFVAIYPDHVPPTSILREFIGGSGFEY